MTDGSEVYKLQARAVSETSWCHVEIQFSLKRTISTEEVQHLDIIDEGVIADAKSNALDRRRVPDGERVLGADLQTGQDRSSAPS